MRLNSLTSACEVFFSNILEAVYQKHPESLGERSIKLSDLFRYESIDEVTQHVITDRTMSILYKPYDSWLDALDPFLGKGRLDRVRAPFRRNQRDLLPVGTSSSMQTAE